MVVVRPFKAVRPKDQNLAEKIASFPYDVINSDEARELVKDNQYSFLHVVKPEVDLDPSVNLYDPLVYQKARENFERFIENGWLIRDEEPHYYVYRQVMDKREQFGLVGCASGEDYWADKIKKHELTRKSKEEDRIKHVDTVNANAGPVFLFYPRRASIDEVVAETTAQEPLYDFTSEDGIQHTVWAVSLQKTGDLRKSFEELPHTYVADGHHRTASGAIIAKRRAEANPNHTGEEEYNFFLAVIFPAEDLKIFDYNRVVKDLNGRSPDEFIAKLAEKCEVVEGHVERKPPAKGTFGMYLGGKWYLLTAKDGTFDADHPIKSLDVSIMQENILTPILGIEDPRTDDRIDFVGGIRGMDELERRVNSGEMAVAFSMYPTSIEELMSVADAGLQMPPKSTWFEPKLRSGLLVHSYEE